MATKKEVALLEDLNNKVKAVIEAQSVLRDNMAETRRWLRAILDKIEDFETTSEILKLSLKRKIDSEDFNAIEKKIVDIERRFPEVNPVR